MRTGITALAVQSTAFRPTSWLALTIVAIGCYGESLAHFGFDGTALATIAAVGIAALLSSIAGFAFSAICGAMLFHLRQDTVGVVQIMLVCSIANQALSVWVLRREIRLRVLSWFLLGGAVGVPAGVWLLLHLNPASYLKGLGGILLLYGGYMLVRPPITLRRSPVIGDLLSGVAGGLASGFAAIPGAPVSIWCSMKGWDKTRQRAVFQPFILLMQIASIIAIATMRPRGGAGVAFPPIIWASVPAGLVGTRWGLNYFNGLTDRQFAIAVNLLLIVSGAALVL